MSDDIEIRLQRVAGHARRGWLGDAARELGVTTRTIQRARSGYIPTSFMKNLEDLERRRSEDGHETEMDRRLRSAKTEARSAGEEEHYLRGLSDGFAAAVRSMREGMKDPATLGLLERMTRARELAGPDIFMKRSERPVGSIGAQMIRRVADRLASAGEIVEGDMILRERPDQQRQVDVMVLVAVQRITEELLTNGEDAARRVCDDEERRLVRGLEKLLRVTLDDPVDTPAAHR